MTEVCEAEQNWRGKSRQTGFVVSTTPSLALFISLFTKEKPFFDRPNYPSTQVFHYKISVKKKSRKEIRFDKQKLFRNSNPIRRLGVARKPV